MSPRIFEIEKTPSKALKTHISSDMCSPTWEIRSCIDMFFPTWETRIPRDKFPTWETHIPYDMCSLSWETHISSDMCFLTWETHIPSDMPSPTWETEKHLLSNSGYWFSRALEIVSETISSVRTEGRELYWAKLCSLLWPETKRMWRSGTFASES